MPDSSAATARASTKEADALAHARRADASICEGSWMAQKALAPSKAPQSKGVLESPAEAAVSATYSAIARRWAPGARPSGRGTSTMAANASATC